MCDELEYEAVKALRTAADHWHKVKRSVIESLLDDQESEVMRIASEIETGESKIARLDRSLTNLDDSDEHTQVIARMLEERHTVVDQCNRHQMEYPHAAAIRTHLLSQLDRCSDGSS